MSGDNWDVTGLCASEAGHMYLEGDTSQSECLEISLGSLDGTQDKTLFTGTDVILPVAVERTHTAGKRAAHLDFVLYFSCDYKTSPHT